MGSRKARLKGVGVIPTIYIVNALESWKETVYSYFLRFLPSFLPKGGDFTHFISFFYKLELWSYPRYRLISRRYHTTNSRFIWIASFHLPFSNGPISFHNQIIILQRSCFFVWTKKTFVSRLIVLISLNNFDNKICGAAMRY